MTDREPGTQPSAAPPGVNTQTLEKQRPQASQTPQGAARKPAGGPQKPAKRHPCLRALGWCFALLTAFLIALGLLFWWWTERLAEEPAPPLLDGVPFSNAVYSAEGALLHLAPASDGIYRLKTPLSAIAKEAVISTVFYEDRYYRKHPGVNPLALVRAAFATATGSRPIGASTITMQVARMRLNLETRSIKGKLAALLVKDALYAIKDKLSGDARGGAILLGLKGVVLIGHGATSVEAVKNGTLATARAVRAGLVDAVASSVDGIVA